MVNMILNQEATLPDNIGLNLLMDDNEEAPTEYVDTEALSSELVNYRKTVISVKNLWLLLIQVIGIILGMVYEIGSNRIIHKINFKYI